MCKNQISHFVRNDNDGLLSLRGGHVFLPDEAISSRFGINSAILHMSEEIASNPSGFRNDSRFGHFSFLSLFFRKMELSLDFFTPAQLDGELGSTKRLKKSFFNLFTTVDYFQPYLPISFTNRHAPRFCSDIPAEVLMNNLSSCCSSSPIGMSIFPPSTS